MQFLFKDCRQSSSNEIGACVKEVESRNSIQAIFKETEDRVKNAKSGGVTLQKKTT